MASTIQSSIQKSLQWIDKDLESSMWSSRVGGPVKKELIKSEFRICTHKAVQTLKSPELHTKILMKLNNPKLRNFFF